MARAFDDLAGHLAKGNWPNPTCTAEKMALHLAIEDAPRYLEDTTLHTEFSGIEDPENHTDQSRRVGDLRQAA
ncbi:hypothetical protein ABZ958_31945 [Streptomyces sp. NPDC046237]|uniref:hypothetical protein n=1 Tax=Streptomyces sp. NPDC046237 TaxID=3154914 RepID=UPI0033D8034C